MTLIKIELERISKSDTPYSTTRIFRDEAKCLLEKINKPDLSINKCIEHLKASIYNMNPEQLLLVISLAGSCREIMLDESERTD